MILQSVMHSPQCEISFRKSKWSVIGIVFSLGVPKQPVKGPEWRCSCLQMQCKKKMFCNGGDGCTLIYATRERCCWCLSALWSITSVTVVSPLLWVSAICPVFALLVTQACDIEACVAKEHKKSCDAHVNAWDRDAVMGKTRQEPSFAQWDLLGVCICGEKRAFSMSSARCVFVVKDVDLLSSEWSWNGSVAQILCCKARLNLSASLLFKN